LPRHFAPFRIKERLPDQVKGGAAALTGSRLVKRLVFLTLITALQQARGFIRRNEIFAPHAAIPRNRSAAHG